jgi:hypothetical protein
LVGVVCKFPLSSSLLTEFLDGRKCSNCDLGCSSFLRRSLWLLPSSRVASLCTLHTERYTATFLLEAGGDSSWCPPCFGRLESISDFRLLTQRYIPLDGQYRWVLRVHVPWHHRRHDVVRCFHIPASEIQSGLTRACKILRGVGGTLAIIRVTTTITITVNYTQESHKVLDLHRPAAGSRTALTLVAPNRRRP